MVDFNAYYLLTIVVIACGSIPKGESAPSAPSPLCGQVGSPQTPSPPQTLLLFRSPCACPCVSEYADGSNDTGYDEGGFSASTGLTSFEEDFGLVSSLWKGNESGLADRKANISSFGVLGAAFGSIIALALNDRLGRLRSWQVFIAVWMTGVLMQVFSSGILGLMLFARIWGGLGAGGLTVVAPLYLSEIAPAKSRGMVVSIYMVILLSFLTIGELKSPIHQTLGTCPGPRRTSD